jgi:CheY-like chemotaxis protein
MTRPLKTVFFVDDSADIHVLAKAGFKRIPELEVHFFTAPAEALARLSELKPDLVISDLQMPEISGIEVLKACLKSSNEPKPVVFILTGESKPEEIAKLTQAGAAKVFDKALGLFKIIAGLKSDWENL